MADAASIVVDFSQTRGLGGLLSESLGTVEVKGIPSASLRAGSSTARARSSSLRSG